MRGGRSRREGLRGEGEGRKVEERRIEGRRVEEWQRVKGERFWGRTHLSLANLSFVAANRNTPPLQEAFDLAREVGLACPHQEVVLLVKLLHTYVHNTQTQIHEERL